MGLKQGFLGLCILLPVVVFATPKVIITEIGACATGDSEWIEVMNISDQAVDLTTWKFYEQETNHSVSSMDVGNGLQPFLDPEEVAVIVDKWEDFSAKLSGFTGKVFDSSWGSLNNSGEMIALRDESGNIDPTEQFTYPSCESGKILERISFDADPTQTESWTLSAASTPGTVGEGFKPSPTTVDVAEDPNPPETDVEEDPYLAETVIAEKDLNPPAEEITEESSSEGLPNESLPTSSDQVQILISETSPKRKDEKGGDFIELYALSAPSDGANLKYMKVKHNGTTLFFLEEDFYVAEGDFILIQDEVGLSAGSGTVEVILYTDTIYETTEDVLCWKDETLSQAETTRTEKFREAGYWTGECYDIADLVKNESIARNTDYNDTNQQSDFFRHFNGSPGTENESQNQPPQAVIAVQGTGRIAGVSPFTFNLTGEDSTDPDGDHDIKSYTWTMNGIPFADQENPPAQKTTIVGTHEIILQVEDFAGETSQAKLIIQVYSASNVGGEIGVVNKPVKLWVRDLLSTGTKKSTQKTNTNNVQEVSEDFFDAFFETVDEKVLEKMIAKSRERRSEFLTNSVGEGSKPSSTNKQEAQTLVALYEEEDTCREQACLFPTARNRKLPTNIRKKASKNLAYIFPEWREQVGETNYFSPSTPADSK